VCWKGEIIIGFMFFYDKTNSKPHVNRILENSDELEKKRALHISNRTMQQHT
jgi:hypothetical protein